MAAKVSVWPEVVYFIRAGLCGPIKIGRASKIQQRLCSLQTGSTEELKVIGLMITNRAAELEAELLDCWSMLRIRGEWFRPHPDLVRFIQEEARSTEADFEAALEAAGAPIPDRVWKVEYPPIDRRPPSKPIRGRTMAERIRSYKESRGLV